MIQKAARSGPAPLHVSIIALPEAVLSTMAGLFDALNGAALVGLATGAGRAPFRPQIIGESAGPIALASGLSIDVQRSIDSVRATDLVIVPSVLLRKPWQKGRYSGLVRWIARMHARGALVCSACSGVFLLGETGLFDGKEATLHFMYARAFSELYPAVAVHPERALVVSGAREELVSSGASSTWHDLALYLTARHAGATTAQEVARIYALQWHQDGLTPYIVFEGKKDHGDAEIAGAQTWLARHFAVAHPVEAVIQRSKLAERTFKRRFTSATGVPPIEYIQRLRVEDAKRRLERTEVSVEEISWQVGYEDAAFFRRLFKRVTGMTPGAYRKRFRIPDFARK